MDKNGNKNILWIMKDIVNTIIEDIKNRITKEIIVKYKKLNKKMFLL